MGVDRNTSITNNTNTTNGDAKDGNCLQQQQPTKATIQLVKDMIEITDEDQNNNNNRDLLNDSQTTSDPSSESSTPSKDLPSEQSQKQKNVEDSKSRTKSPCHISTLSSKAKNLKLNTAKALQQQQEQAQQQNAPASKSKQHHQQQNQTISNHEYLAQLLKDKRQLLSFPSSFSHVHRILDNEINRVRITLLHQNSEEGRLELPEPEGEMVTLTKKLFVPQKDYPEFNFVGRILGPRGMTAKQLEQDTGCKIMIRGKGSMRDKTKEEMYRGKPNWEHLDDELHVLITVEDSENRASLKLERAVRDVQKLLVPSAEGEDSLKKLQLMELAIINGTYRDLGRHHLNGQMAQIIPMTSAVSGLASPQVCVSGSTLIGQPGSQHPPPTPTLVTTPVLLTPRIAPYFPPPGVLTRTSMMNPGQQGAGYSVDLQHYDRQQHQQQQQTSTGLVFQIDPNYVAFHHSPFLEFALFGNNRQAPQESGAEEGALN